MDSIVRSFAFAGSPGRYGAPAALSFSSATDALSAPEHNGLGSGAARADHVPVVTQPAGTVTLVFTDIEGSTRLLRELGRDHYREALAEHRRIVRNACARHDGYEVDCEGDAFFYAFQSASEAVAAVEEAMRELESGPIRLRVGVHTGEPALDPPKYVGLDLHLAARVMAAGHGGQMLLSKATRDLVEVEVKDLGEHRLRDIAEPVWLYQLGDGAFPPLRSLNNTNLPTPASSLLGREAELEEAGHLLAGCRLLTVSGPGGAGKTRFAIELAARQLPRFRNGVFWVALAGLRDPALVIETIAQTLGAREGLAAHIGTRRMLLLLDNLEQVIAAAPELSELLSVCPHLSLLVTSRELLRVQGEFEFALPPLASKAAVELFCARGRCPPDATVAELCRRLEGLPLAIELAAARLPVLSANQLLERLGERLDLLRGGRDADPRQQTLRTTIEWSHDLLDEAERRLFARLAVFRGGCTIDAAVRVAGAELDTLQSLVAKSLLRRSEERFWMLETIREFAAGRLEQSAERNELRAAHAEWVLALVRELATPVRHGASPAFEQMALERDNVRAALAWSAGDGDPRIGLELVGRLCVYWAASGLVTEGVAAAERALAAGASLSASERLAGLLGAAEILRFAGNCQRAIALYEQALPLLAGLEDETVIPVMDGLTANEATISVLKDLASTLAQLDDFDRARRRAEEALRRAEALGDPTMVAHSLTVQALVEFLAGRIEEAKELYSRALPMWEALDWLPERASVQLMVGECARRQGSIDEAADSIHLALDLAASIGYMGLVQEVWQELAAVALLRDGGELGAQLLGASERLRETGGWPLWDPADFEQTVESLRRALGEDTFEQARAAGRALSDEDALVLARTIE